MERKVDSPGNVFGTQDYGLDNETKLIRKVHHLKTIGRDLLAKSTSVKMLKSEFRPWLTEYEIIVKEADHEKMKELDELYRDLKSAESLAAEENAGETSQEDTAESLVAEENVGEANEGGKKVVAGMGGVGKVKLVNKEAVDMEFEEISVTEENAGEKSPKKKNSSKAVVGMGGVGDTDIENKGEVKMKFKSIRM